MISLSDLQALLGPQELPRRRGRPKTVSASLPPLDEIKFRLEVVEREIKAGNLYLEEIAKKLGCRPFKNGGYGKIAAKAILADGLGTTVSAIDELLWPQTNRAILSMRQRLKNPAKRR